MMYLVPRSVINAIVEEVDIPKPRICPLGGKAAPYGHLPLNISLQ